MNEREKVIRLWFDMWLQKKDLGISEMFSDNAVYTESWGPEYHGSAKIKLWFDEWNTRGTVLQWDIKQFFHKENQTMVEWYFKNQMNSDDKILFLKEFGCNINNYDPYQNGDTPQFKDEKISWF